MPPRGRTDRGRRERLVAATIAVIAERGIEGVTHRAVADAAGVPLGSTTYHLGGRDELLTAALRAAADAYNARLRGWFEALPADADLAAALAGLILDDTGAGRDRTVVECELYLAALRRPALRPAATAWLRDITELIAERTDPATARALAAALDGLLLEALIADPPLTRADLVPVLRRVLR
jgi:TetR/AcrR family transcriptional regulator, regulator of biofilm formation and stress response